MGNHNTPTVSAGSKIKVKIGKQERKTE